MVFAVSSNWFDRSPNVNRYLALSFRQIAMGPEQTPELTALEDAMDELWLQLLEVEQDEVNKIISRALAFVRADAGSAALSSAQAHAAFSSKNADVAIIGQAFRKVMAQRDDYWQMKGKSPFVPMIMDHLARLPDLAPSDEDYGKAFLEVLRDPEHAWRDAPVWPFIQMVAEKAAVLDAQAQLQERILNASLRQSAAPR